MTILDSENGCILAQSLYPGPDGLYSYSVFTPESTEIFRSRDGNAEERARNFYKEQILKYASQS